MKGNFLEKFTFLTDQDLNNISGKEKRDYDWGYSIGKSIRNGVNGTIKFVKGLF